LRDIKLHGFQNTLKGGVYGEWNAGHRNVLARLDTGGGKSVIASDIILDGVKQGMKQAVIAHRNELVGQMSCHIAGRGIPHRIVGADSTITQIRRLHRAQFGDTLVNPAAPTLVAGVDTMVRREDLLGKDFNQMDRWVIDEAHHVLRANKWGKAVTMMPNAQGLGVTATPLRADGKGLGVDFDGVFHSMVSGPNMRYR